tara:strand:- start:298 stop:459 length:162 start_codon:yes stop_codon:yes gene_type:complete
LKSEGRESGEGLLMIECEVVDVILEVFVKPFVVVALLVCHEIGESGANLKSAV